MLFLISFFLFLFYMHCDIGGFIDLVLFSCLFTFFIYIYYIYYVVPNFELPAQNFEFPIPNSQLPILNSQLAILTNFSSHPVGWPINVPSISLLIKNGGVMMEICTYNLQLRNCTFIIYSLFLFLSIPKSYIYTSLYIQFVLLTILILL